MVWFGFSPKCPTIAEDGVRDGSKKYKTHKKLFEKRVGPLPSPRTTNLVIVNNVKETRFAMEKPFMWDPASQKASRLLWSGLQRSLALPPHSWTQGQMATIGLALRGPGVSTLVGRAGNHRHLQGRMASKATDTKDPPPHPHPRPELCSLGGEVDMSSKRQEIWSGISR
jgi:hypothetical protein